MPAAQRPSKGSLERMGITYPPQKGVKAKEEQKVIDNIMNGKLEKKEKINLDKFRPYIPSKKESDERMDDIRKNHIETEKENKSIPKAVEYLITNRIGELATIVRELTEKLEDCQNELDELNEFMEGYK